MTFTTGTDFTIGATFTTGTDFSYIVDVSIALTGLGLTVGRGSFTPAHTQALPQLFYLYETIKFILGSGERSDLILTSSQLKFKNASGGTDNMAQL